MCFYICIFEHIFCSAEFRNYAKWEYHFYLIDIYILFLSCIYIYIYIYISSSSSYRAGSTDIPDPLSPLLPIVHRPR